jgi:ankyrin repeat protein
VDVRLVNVEDLMPVTALHGASVKGNLPSVKFFIEECGLSVDELAPKELFTPLICLCLLTTKGNEERSLPIARYLLAKGADINKEAHLGFAATYIALDKGWHTMHKLLVSHARVKQAERAKAARRRRVVAASRRRLTPRVSRSWRKW